MTPGQPVPQPLLDLLHLADAVRELSRALGNDEYDGPVAFTFGGE